MFDTLPQRWHQFVAVPPGQRFQAHFARRQQTRPRGLHHKILANLLVCLLVDDMPDQADAAEALLVANTVFISRIVLLESEWVLRSGYRKTREQISRFRRRFASRGLWQGAYAHLRSGVLQGRAGTGTYPGNPGVADMTALIFSM